MSNSIKIENPTQIHFKEILFLLASVICTVAVLTYLLNYFNSFLAIEIFLILVFILYLYYFTRSIPLLLIIISILPLVDLNKGDFYNFRYLLLQNIPLYFFFLLAILTYLYRNKQLKKKLPYLLLTVFIYSGYSLLLFFLGLINGASFSLGFNELYQNFYFFFAIPIYYLFEKEDDYIISFRWVIITFTIVSVGYIIINFSNSIRFTTFQNHFLPFIVAALSAALLFNKNKFGVKINLILLLIIVFWGSIVTETRTLLIANLLSLFIVIFFFIKQKVKGIRRIIYIISLSILLIIPTLSLKGDNTQKIKNPVSSKERFEAIANPSSDISFLMRVEAVYLGAKKFLKNPILGEGFGFKLQLKWLLKTAYLYPDNSFLYYMLKGGIVFLAIALYMYYVLFKFSYRVFKYSTSTYARYMALAIISGMIGILLTGMLNANLVRFKLNIIYALFFAFIEFENSRISVDNYTGAEQIIK